MPAPLEVPLLDLQRQYEGIRTEIHDALDRVLATQRFVLGPEVEAFEREFAEFCETRFAVGCASGTDALALALEAAGIGPGDEVLCPAYTFVATASSAARLGARPVFVDIDPDTCSMDPESAEQAAARCTRLRAIVPVHLFGRTLELAPFRDLAERHGALLLEDAAQAIGARNLAGRPVGSIGAIGAFSLYPTKNLGAYGDAGIVTTDDPALAERITSLRAHGESGGYRHAALGLNSRLDALQAAVLRVKLRHLPHWTKQRRENALAYQHALIDAGACRSVDALPQATLPLQLAPLPDDPAAHVVHHYVLRTRARLRDALREELARRGVATAVYYPRPLHQQPCFATLPAPVVSLRESEAAAEASFAIPVHPELTRAQREHVAQSLIEAATALG